MGNPFKRNYMMNYRISTLEKSNKLLVLLTLSGQFSLQETVLLTMLLTLECHFENHVALSLKWAYHYYAQKNHR